MKRWSSIIIAISLAALITVVFAGCKTYEINVDRDISDSQDESIDKSDTTKETGKNSGSEETDTPNLKKRCIDVVVFMGESNMSGFGGDAQFAPKVSEDAGMEYRAVSDSTRLYPITEPFGTDESNPSGLNDFPGVKKGSLVSAFINEYHELTGRQIIAVSASMGSTDMDIWTSEGVMNDVRQRLDTTLSYLDDNGYDSEHIYAVWLQGESDGMKGTAESTYREALEKMMKPLFKDGLQKVFIIVPGRTIDLSDAYLNVINAEINLCTDDDRFALATTVLPKVSTEFMTDQYQYNQHVLNYVGNEAAKSVAYYTKNGVKKIVYDFKQGKYVVPKGVKENSQEKEELIYPSDLDINKLY